MRRRGGRERRLVLPAMAVLACGAVASAAFAAAPAPVNPVDHSTVAPAALAHTLATVSSAALNKVGPGRLATVKQGLDISTIHQGTAAGVKPTMYFVGEEWCPHCLSLGWSLVVALDRFGTFDHLATQRSGTYFGTHGGIPPLNNVPGFTFYGTTYTSSYLTFVPLELGTVTNKPLDHPTKAEAALFRSLDPKGVVPALDVGGLTTIAGEPFDPSVLLGKGFTEIAGDLNHPASQVAARIDGAANLLTAAICRATAEQPAAVCGASGVKAAASRL
jgi:hypothetical protein